MEKNSGSLPRVGATLVARDAQCVCRDRSRPVPAKETMKIFPTVFLIFLMCARSLFADRKYDDIINDCAAEYGLDPSLIKAVIKTESNFNRYCVSSKGAVGLMQLMPSTADILKVKDRTSPEENIRAGSRYLRDMLSLFGGDLSKALAAYNAGPSKVRQHGGIPPYKETRDYVKKVITNRSKFSGSGKIYYYTASDGSVVFFNR